MPAEYRGKLQGETNRSSPSYYHRVRTRRTVPLEGAPWKSGRHHSLMRFPPASKFKTIGNVASQIPIPTCRPCTLAYSPNHFCSSFWTAARPLNRGFPLTAVHHMVRCVLATCCCSNDQLVRSLLSQKSRRCGTTSWIRAPGQRFAQS